jgi:uncharacterized protein YciI
VAKYVVIYEEEQGGAPNLLKDHVEHVRNLHSQRIIFLCGLLKDSGKGFLISEANSQEEAESYVLKDPFIIHKWYPSYRVYELIEANDSNNYLMNG